jgi:hypothetical protein
LTCSTSIIQLAAGFPAPIFYNFVRPEYAGRPALGEEFLHFADYVIPRRKH